MLSEFRERFDEIYIYGGANRQAGLLLIWSQ